VNLKKIIKRILREDKQLIPMIRRRISNYDLETQFLESLISTRDMFEYNKRRDETMTRSRFTNVVVSMMIDGIHYDLHSTTPEDSQWYDNVYDSLKDYYKDRIDEYYDNLIEKILSEESKSKFFKRRIDIDDVEYILWVNADQVYHETESYEHFKFELTLRAVEALMWNDYELGWEDLPEQEEIEFVTEVSDILEDKIKKLYNTYNKR